MRILVFETRFVMGRYSTKNNGAQFLFVYEDFAAEQLSHIL